MKYKVLGNLKHNLEDYSVGDIIELDDDTAKSLLADEIISLLEEEKKEEKKVEEIPSVEEKIVKKPRKK